MRVAGGGISWYYAQELENNSIFSNTTEILYNEAVKENIYETFSNGKPYNTLLLAGPLTTKILISRTWTYGVLFSGQSLLFYFALQNLVSALLSYQYDCRRSKVRRKETEIDRKRQKKRMSSFGYFNDSEFSSPLAIWPNQWHDIWLITLVFLHLGKSTDRVKIKNLKVKKKKKRLWVPSFPLAIWL